MPTRDTDCFVVYGESYTLQRARFDSQRMEMEAVKQELDVSLPQQSHSVYLFCYIRQCLCLFQTSPTEVAVATILALYSSMVHPPPPVAENELNDVMNGSVINVRS